MTKQSFKQFFSKKENRLYFNAILSAVITLIFALFNGFVGVFGHSIWNGSICVYYLVLLLIRAVVLFSENKIRKKSTEIKEKTRIKIFYITTIFSFVLNLALFVPLALMVLNQKPVTFGLIPAIAMAAYTTYKIIMASVNYTKYRKGTNLAIRQLQILNFVDAIVAVLTLQNTLIVVNSDNSNDNLLALTATSTFAGIVLMLAVSIVALVRIIKQQKCKKIKLS